MSAIPPQAAIKFTSNIYDPWRKIPDDFSDPMTFTKQVRKEMKDSCKDKFLLTEAFFLMHPKTLGHANTFFLKFFAAPINKITFLS